MLTQLSAAPEKLVGAKQAKRAIRDGRGKRLFLALDADPRVTEPLAQLAQERNIPVQEVASMADLGGACGISVGAAVALIL